MDRSSGRVERAVGMKAEFLMLAHPADADLSKYVGWYASEKLDGIRCFWDGGLTRGLLNSRVPWANTSQGRLQVCTGLWSRYGNVIAAPPWFLDSLPPDLLDGELKHCDGFQATTSACKKLVSVDAEWRGVTYCAFERPQWQQILVPRTIDEINFQKAITPGMLEWVRERTGFYDHTYIFAEVRSYMMHMAANEHFKVIDQVVVKSVEDIKSELDRAMAKKHGEGLMLRDPNSVWTPERVHTLVKLKPTADAEGKVVGYTAGKEGKTGRLLGRIGALQILWNGKLFELSGMDDVDREFDSDKEKNYAMKFPGENMFYGAQGKTIRLGDMVTFTYRSLTNKGKPKEARFKGVRVE